MCYVEEVSTIGVRELRQNASEILREVEAGEPATVTVAGRPVAQIVPLRADSWASWERIGSIYESATDAEWDADRRGFAAAGLNDPWDR